jgi:hypothetical protein
MFDQSAVVEIHDHGRTAWSGRDSVGCLIKSQKNDGLTDSRPVSETAHINKCLNI